MSLAGIQIVLFEPLGSLNVGSVARVMKNMGLQHLVLVNPQCDQHNAEARQMAVHAADILETAQAVATLSEALKGCQRVIATTGRPQTTLEIPLEHPRQALPWLLSPSESTLGLKPTSALLFGREDRGLTNAELQYAQRLVYIPTSTDYPSLNLAQAVAICCYELQAAASSDLPVTPSPVCEIPASIAPSLDETTDETTPSSRSPGSTPARQPHPADDESSDLASFDALEAYYQQLEALLLDIGYLYPHTAASRMSRFRRLINRAYPSNTEVAMLRGILRQMRWALTQGK